jgi:hypothetical protein
VKAWVQIFPLQAGDALSGVKLACFVVERATPSLSFLAGGSFDFAVAVL